MLQCRCFIVLLNSSKTLNRLVSYFKIRLPVFFILRIIYSMNIFTGLLGLPWSAGSSSLQPSLAPHFPVEDRSLTQPSLVGFNCAFSFSWCSRHLYGRYSNGLMYYCSPSSVATIVEKRVSCIRSFRSGPTSPVEFSSIRYVQIYSKSSLEN